MVARASYSGLPRNPLMVPSLLGCDAKEDRQCLAQNRYLKNSGIPTVRPRFYVPLCVPLCCRCTCASRTIYVSLFFEARARHARAVKKHASFTQKTLGSRRQYCFDSDSGHTHLNAHTYTHTYTHAHTDTRTHTRTHTETHAYTRIHAHTRTHFRRSKSSFIIIYMQACGY
jgi:hypothetical protein